MSMVAEFKLSARFPSRKRLARRFSTAFSMFCHSAISIYLISCVFQPGMDKPESARVSTEEDKNKPSEEPIELVEVAEANGVADVAMPTSVARARLQTGLEDASRKSKEELTKKLDSLTGQAGMIDDESLDAIGAFLGKKSGEYEPRTYYLDELNRNADLSQSKIIRAFAFHTPQGEMAYTITLEDAEKDRYTFTLLEENAKQLRDAGASFAGAKMNDSAGVSTFELKGASIRDIKRWKREDDKIGRRGAVVTLADPGGKEIILHFKGERYAPFMKEQIRFMQKRLGLKQDETTLHTEGFDMEHAALLPTSKEDIFRDGEKLRVRQVLVDKNGERLIMFIEGKQAEEFLDSTKVLRNGVIGNIYKRIGMSILPGMAQDQQKEKERLDRLAEKKRQEEENRKSPAQPKATEKETITNEDAENW
ncbi:MAG: hypothetical protein JXR97_06775 [Planctomycetes bacterium]|nr:hypothetical protein [Planctomycetota bacterium]